MASSPAVQTALSPTDPRKYLSSVIFDYARRIGHIQDRESLLEAIADLGRDLVQADRCSIWLIDRDRRELVTRVAHGTETLRIPAGQGFAGQSIATGEVVICNSPHNGDGVSRSVDSRTGYRTESLIVVPMRSSGGEVIGAFQALNKPGGFSPEDADLLKLAANYSASTLEAQSSREAAEQARRLERELEIAREVQQRLLPELKLMRIAGCEMFGRCRPASEVGGDYFAYFPSGPDSVILAAGDVSGKGIAAALMMASTQATLRGLVTNPTWEPRETMDHVNQTVFDTSTASRYSTLFLAHYDSSNRLLSTVNAGHCPPILLRADGSVSQIESDGPPVGLLPRLRFTGQQHELQSGDTLVCYSDGISECHDPKGEIWSEEEFLDVLRKVRTLPLEEIAARVIDAADEFAHGAPQHDDMTLVCLRVL
jgi:serine phosphatase RsbU (regulator of sigma subunit)